MHLRSMIMLFFSESLPARAKLWQLRMSIVLENEHRFCALVSQQFVLCVTCEVSSVQDQYTNFCVRKHVGVRRCLFGGLSKIQPNGYEGGNNGKRTPTMCSDIRTLKVS